MLSNTSAEWFVSRVANLSFPNSFNPYTDHCDACDLPGAAAIRRRNLTNCLSAALERGVDSLWIGRDLGYRGGRRTGLALTDDLTIGRHASLCGAIGLSRATGGPPVAERTAKIIWHALAAIQQRVFLWNVFPLHPHQPNEPFTNRNHTSIERESCRFLTAWLVQNLAPVRVVAIGNDAAACLEQAGVPCIKVRHPSYGGQAEFLSQIGQIYGVHL